MGTEHSSPPPPLEGDERLITIVITAGWAVALVVLLIARGSLPPAEHWWLWTCAAGVALGLFGLWYVPRLQRRRSRLAGRRTGRPPGQRAGGEAGQDLPGSGSKTVSSSATPGRSIRS